MIFYIIGGSFLVTLSGVATIFGTINSFTEYQNLSNVFKFQNINKYSGVKNLTFRDYIHNYNISNDKQTLLYSYVGLQLSEAMGYKTKLNNVVTYADFANWTNDIRSKIPNYSLDFPNSKKFLNSIINISYIKANNVGFILGSIISGIGILSLLGSVAFYFSSNHRLSFDEEKEKEGLFFRKTKKNENEYSYKNHRNNDFDYDVEKTNRSQTRHKPSYINKKVNNENKFSSKLNQYDDYDDSFTFFGQSTKINSNKSKDIQKTKSIQISQKQTTNFENKNARFDTRNLSNTIKIDFDKYKKDNQDKK